MLIAISKGIGDWQAERFAPWLMKVSPGVETVELSSLSYEDAVKMLQKVDGIVFTGGEDIDPKRYAKPEFADLCGAIDPVRDAKECEWFSIALKTNIPILAVCRGIQLANVALGGSLIPDLETADNHRIDDNHDAEHLLTIEPDSILSEIAHSTEGKVNSSHHQAVDRLAETLRVTARADDGTIEAVEWNDPNGKPFFLGVQWHPERMEPQEDQLAAGIARAFINACLQRE